MKFKNKEMSLENTLLTMKLQWLSHLLGLALLQLVEKLLMEVSESALSSKSWLQVIIWIPWWLNPRRQEYCCKLDS